MSFQFTQWMSYLGLAGSLALVIAPAAKAQVAVTGGTASGDAAFFVPTTGAAGNVTLFGAAVRALRLETVIGTTTSARFTPSGARFNDVDNSGTPNSNDTGTLVGTLAGIAFTSSGSIVPFQGLPTTLSFTLNNFTSQTTSSGSLINGIGANANNAPIFFPFQLSVNSSNYSSTLGSLQAGRFTANLTNGSINLLPPNLRFQALNTSPDDNSLIVQKVNFELKGNGRFLTNAQFLGSNSGSADLDGTDGNISVGSTDAKDIKFKIQTIGSASNPSLIIEGKDLNGSVNIEVYGITNLTQQGILNTSTSSDFSIKGKGRDFTALLGSSSVDFRSNDSNSEFEFKQGSSSVIGQSSHGITRFNIAPVVSTLDNFGFYNFPSSSNSTTASSSSSSTSSSSTSNSASTFISLFTLNSFSSNTGTVYNIYQTSNPSVIVVERGKKKGHFHLVERGRGHKYGHNRVVAAYQIVGAPSRIFPGLVGLQQVPVDETETGTTGTTDTTTPTGATGLPGIPETTTPAPSASASPAASPETTVPAIAAVPSVPAIPTVP